MQWRYAAVAFELEEVDANMFAAALPRSGAELPILVTFTILVVIAARMDLRYRRIPNSLALTILLVGSVFAMLTIGPAKALPQILEGSAAGLMMWLPFWALRMLGAGDVKFFAAAAAWLGPRLAFEAALASAVFGGAIALLWLLWISRPAVRVSQAPHAAAASAFGVNDELAIGQDAQKGRISLPYGVAMAAGLAVTAWFPHLIYR
jgi:prepilin peptidase CpaA